MATRIRVKRKKQIRDRVTAHKLKPAMGPHKIDNARSEKMKARKINRAE